MGCSSACAKQQPCGQNQVLVPEEHPTLPNGPTTDFPIAQDQVAVAFFAEVRPTHAPRTFIQLDGDMAVAWQHGTVAVDQWTDFTEVALEGVEASFAKFREGNADEAILLQVDRHNLSIDFDTMVQRVATDVVMEAVTPVNTIKSKSSSSPVTISTLCPVRRLERIDGCWRVTHPDPWKPHPLRLQRLSRDSDDWLNNEYFWSCFGDVLLRVGYPVTHKSADRIFDFAQNQDFRYWTGSQAVVERGGMEYRLPVGWKRFAVRTTSRYDGGDNTWRSLDGREGEWAVAYHGTHRDALGPILFEGLKPGNSQLHEDEVGIGIYCTPSIDIAEQFSWTAIHLGHTVRFVIQCRVAPNAIKKCSTPDFWVIRDPADIRPYGVLVKEVPTSIW